jgi:hypothetical protein
MATPKQTNVLALPLVSIDIGTGSNEDWIDSLKFVVNDSSSTDPNSLPQLDLRGIAFEMEIRRSTSDHEVILAASTKNGQMIIGNPPDFGFLIINVPQTTMATKQPGSYVGDIVGSDDTNSRVCAKLTLTIDEGVTR